jgi:hypothetical protein
MKTYIGATKMIEDIMIRGEDGQFEKITKTALLSEMVRERYGMSLCDLDRVVEESRMGLLERLLS